MFLLYHLIYQKWQVTIFDFIYYKHKIPEECFTRYSKMTDVIKHQVITRWDLVHIYYAKVDGDRVSLLHSLVTSIQWPPGGSLVVMNYAKHDFDRASFLHTLGTSNQWSPGGSWNFVYRLMAWMELKFFKSLHKNNDYERIKEINVSRSILHSQS